MDSAYKQEVTVGALVLVGQIVGETLAAPAVALLSTLLYFDLKARRNGY